MAYQLELAEQPGYLHVRVTGTNSRETVAAYLAAVLAECRARGCDRVLIEECLDGPRLETLEVFALAADGAQQAVGAFTRCAYVDVHASGDLMAFAETVAVNRALPVRVFPTVAAAQAWLTAGE